MKNITNYNDIEITLHYDENKGHDGLDQNNALKVIYEILGIEN